MKVYLLWHGGYPEENELLDIFATRGLAEQALENAPGDEAEIEEREVKYSPGL